MNNVTSLSEIKSAKISSDFQKQDINFDIDKLKKLYLIDNLITTQIFVVR